MFSLFGINYLFYNCKTIYVWFRLSIPERVYVFIPIPWNQFGRICYIPKLCISVQGLYFIKQHLKCRNPGCSLHKLIIIKVILNSRSRHNNKLTLSWLAIRNWCVGICCTVWVWEMICVTWIASFPQWDYIYYIIFFCDKTFQCAMLKRFDTSTRQDAVTCGKNVIIGRPHTAE